VPRLELHLSSSWSMDKKSRIETGGQQVKIIRPYAKLLSPWNTPHFGDDCMRFIEWCARISHRSEEAQTPDSWKRFLQAVVIEKCDWSVVEHISVSVDAVIDRGITHEWVRHRLNSYTQESTRFVNYEKKMPPSFIYPRVGIECKACLSGVEVDGDWTHENSMAGDCAYSANWLRAIRVAEQEYINLIKEGWRPQEARSVFPNALASRIISTTNLRCWRHILIMRTSLEAHPQMRQVTIPLLAEFQKTFPILFDDIVPNEKQSIAMRKAQ
jgi:thymidylate synthase (FAD)